MKIIIFLQGTSIMHKSGLGKTPQERVTQVRENDPTVHEYESYVPIGKANEKIKKWKDKGVEIFYLSSHRNENDIKKDVEVLRKYDFPESPILYRNLYEAYADIAEKIMPDVLVEDDCGSIGGEREMIYPYINTQKRDKIKSVVVKEFFGIDDLPDDPDNLLI